MHTLSMNIPHPSSTSAAPALPLSDFEAPLSEATGFDDLGLLPEIVSVLKTLGYEAPTPIQERAIPVLLEGKSLLGQAQTGTGKTGAFALPLLSRLEKTAQTPQILVLTPTRELALQVAEAFHSYAQNMRWVHVLPMYGGQSMGQQISQLRRGAQIIVGTPGRVMDHLRRKTLDLSALKTVVLDEADEMLNMGFLEDIEWILEHTPAEKQIALFSATMPDPIRRVARKHLKNAPEIKIESETTTVKAVSQHYWVVSGLHKLDALTRILETSDFDAGLLFVRTKTATVELAEKLEARGYRVAALNGDLTQVHRERTVEALKSGKLDLVVATDVAARGLDVDRISLVVNFDIPYDAQTYVHRIGRTGRAGRSGTAILFVSPRERHLLRSIEYATRQPLSELALPTKKDVSELRVKRFKDTISKVMSEQPLDFFRKVVEELSVEKGCSVTDVAAALCCMAQKKSPLVLEEAEVPKEREHRGGDRRGGDRRGSSRDNRGGGGPRRHFRGQRSEARGPDRNRRGADKPARGPRK